MDDQFRETLKAAKSARHDGRLTESLELYLQATQMVREQGNKLVLAHTIRHLADVHRNLGNLDEAEPLYVEALQIYRGDSGTSELELANALRPMALLMEANTDYEQALLLWQEARALYESCSIEAGVTECREAIERCASNS